MKRNIAQISIFYIPLIFPFIIFLLIKANNIEIRLSDTNKYFYIAHQLVLGKILYKDIFFTNFPLFPYISAVYFFIVQGKLLYFYFIPAFEAIIVSIFMYSISYKKTKSIFLSLSAVVFYLFSFIVLSTSDHHTGIFTASAFVIISYYFYSEKRYIFSGIFIALTLLTKAYFLPIFLAMFFALLWVRNWRQSALFLSYTVLTAVIVLLPILLLARNELFLQVFYSLTRSHGTPKLELISQFISKDLVFFLLLLLNLFNFKNPFYVLTSLFSLIFIFFYGDAYYLYLNIFIPFLCISLASLGKFTEQHLKLNRVILFSALCILGMYNYQQYYPYKDQQKITNLKEILTIVKNEKPEALYGITDFVPAVSYLTGISIIDGFVEANDRVFERGIMDRSEITKHILSKKTIIIAHGFFYPEQNIREDIVDDVLDLSLVKHCKISKSFPVNAEYHINRINIIKCY